MRFFAICLMLGLVLGAQPASAADCDVEVRRGDRSSDLTRKLQCLQDRIAKLEGLLQGGGSASGADRLAALKRGAGSGRIDHRGILVSLEKCSLGRSRDIYCQYQLINTTSQDKEVCFGSQSRVVTDKGQTFSRSYRSVASVSSSRTQVCDRILPRVKAIGWVRFNGSKGAAISKVQLIRLDCGSGCIHEAYDVPIQ